MSVAIPIPFRDTNENPPKSYSYFILLLLRDLKKKIIDPQLRGQKLDSPGTWIICCMATTHVRQPHRAKWHRTYEYISGNDNDANSAFEIWMQPHHFYPRYDFLRPVFFPFGCAWAIPCKLSLPLPACFAVCLSFFDLLSLYQGLPTDRFSFNFRY